jgi:hypothetical protein
MFRNGARESTWKDIQEGILWVAFSCESGNRDYKDQYPNVFLFIGNDSQRAE